MLRAHLVFLIIGLISPYAISKHVQFYRKDYTYIEEHDAFYKVHWDVSGSIWSFALDSCYKEGAKLFYPNGDEWTIVKNLTDAMAIAPNTSEIYVGLHDEFNLGEFITIDGRPTDSPLNIVEENATALERCMMMNYESGQFRVAHCSQPPNALPYVCKKVDEESCPTIDHEYKYSKSSKKCYKVNKIEKTWTDAMKTCYMEGGILAVFQTRDEVPTSVRGNVNYFIGIRRMFSTFNFYTVKGIKYENDNFDNEYYRVNYPSLNCGAMQFNNDELKLNTVECNESRPFICEMEVPT